MSEARSEKHLGIILLAGVSAGWGFNWPALKTALAEIPVWQFRGVSLLAAALLLLALARAMGQPMRVPRGQWPILLIAAAFNITGWHMAVAFGVRIMAAGQASLLAFTMPVWAAILGALFLGESLTVRRIVALLVGVAAIAVLLLFAGEDMGVDPVGAAIMVGAALSWATGTVIQRGVSWAVPSIPLAGWQILAGCTPILLAAALTEEFVMLDVSLPAQLSTLYLILIPLSFCYYGWFRVVTIFPAMIAGLGTLMVPVLGLVSSGLILGEPLGWPQFTALVLVLIALALVFTERPARPAPAAKAPPKEST